MEFYLKLASIEDDKKLKGIVLFEDYGEDYPKKCCEPLILGKGCKEYYHTSDEEFYVCYAYEMEKIINKISSILPNARICFTSLQDEGTGESDVFLKKENDPTIYNCSTIWEEFEFGSDEWCEQAIIQYEEELAEQEEIMKYIEEHS